MPLDIAPIKADVVAALKADGVPVVVVQKKGTANVVNGRAENKATFNHTGGYGLRIPLEADSVIDKNTFPNEYGNFVVAGCDYKPKKGDFLIFGGNTWTVLTSTTIAPTGELILWKCEAAR